MSTSPLANPKVGNAEWKLPIYGDIVNVTKNLSDGNLRFGDVTSMISLHMGLLDTALDPIGAVMRSAVDFLMRVIVDTIKPLKEAVDWLLGDPPGIAAAAKGWTDTANNVAAAGNSFVDSLGGLDGWEGPASQAYKGVVRTTHGVYTEAADSASEVAGWVGLAGGIVGIFREFIWGLLVDFVTEVIKAAILAIASSVPTVGASIGAFGTWLGARFTMIAGKFTKTLSKLMTKMGDLCKKLGKSGRSFYVAAEKLRQVSSRLGRRASGGFGRSGVDAKPTMPGSSKDSFNEHMPGYSDFKDRYGTVKKGTDAIDKGLGAADTDDVKDLPPGY